MDDTGLVSPELDATLVQLGESLLDVVGDRVRLRVGHQTPASENRSEAAYVLHHVGSGDGDVEVHPARADLLDQIGITDICGTGIESLLRLLALGEYEDPLLCLELVGKDDRIPDGLALLEVEADGDLDSLGELRECAVLHKLGCLLEAVQLASVDLLCGFLVFLSSLHLTSPPLRPWNVQYRL